MSVVIRLTTTGKTHNISYRIVVAEKWSKRDGKFIENLGFYNPLAPKGENYKIDSKRYDYWLSKGAKPSPAVTEIVTNEGIRPPKISKRKAKALSAEAESKEAKAENPSSVSSEAQAPKQEDISQETPDTDNKQPAGGNEQSKEPKE